MSAGLVLAQSSRVDEAFFGHKQHVTPSERQDVGIRAPVSIC